MLRGFIGGSLALIVLYALTQDRAATNITKGTTAATGLLDRFLSPGVAGIPQRKSVGQAVGSAAATGLQGVLSGLQSSTGITPGATVTT